MLGALVAGLAAWALNGFMLRNAESDARILHWHLQVPVAAVLGGLAGLAGTWVETAAFVVLATASGLLTVIDLAEERLPDAIVLPLITGAFCGWFSWGSVLLGFAAAWITFAALGVVLLATRKRHGRNSFAFGPFMILGAVIGVVWAGAVLPW